ncbi:unnamed protein product [Ambrosiozyma monospora]|uniref:Unnamed protein product n=1 Tax=Ambrosiozyma monospora TaxID=43982 RepID=A0ACB5T871_AMBMO|nr:unnamed protein product [Ambrosiozyma monospora]
MSSPAPAPTPSPSLSVELNGSVALKLTTFAEESYPNIETGPILGFDKKDTDANSISINITKIFQFPVNNNDEIFTLRGYNGKYQNDVLAKLKDTKTGVKLLGWFISTTNGKFISQTIVDSMVHLQEYNKRENKDETPILYLVYDPSKALDGVLSLKVFKLSEQFIKTYYSEDRFIPKNLIENKLSYKNIFEEVPTTLKNTFLTNLKT